MEVTIRAIGNSKGILLPKPLLAQAGLEGHATATIKLENGAIVLRKPAKAVRAGWAKAAAAITANSGDDLLLGDFGNEDN